MLPNWLFVVLDQVVGTLDLTKASLLMEGSPLGVIVFVRDSDHYCRLFMRMDEAEKHLLGV